MPSRPVFDHWFAQWSAIAVGVFVLITGVLVVASVRNRASRRRTLPFGGATRTNVVEGGIVTLLAAAGFLVWGSLTANPQVSHGVGQAADASPPPASRPNAASTPTTRTRCGWSSRRRARGAAGARNSAVPHHVTMDSYVRVVSAEQYQQGGGAAA